MGKNIIEKTIEAPAEMLEMGVEGGQKLAHNMAHGGYNKPLNKAKNYWYLLGPGLTTGASDDDPSGIATYSQAGAQTGFGFLWTAAFYLSTYGSYTGDLCPDRFSYRPRLSFKHSLALRQTHSLHRPAFLFAANTFNIGADIGAMANATQLVFKLNTTLLVVGTTLLILLLQIFTPYVKYARYLKWLAMVLLAYIVSAILAHPHWGSIAKNTFVPHITFTKSNVILLCAVLGTTITPYLFFWQTSQEVEEEIAQGKLTITERRGSDKADLKKMRIDVWSGMFFSNLVMFFIIAACASVLFTHGITNINTAAQAARALRPFAGAASYYLFAGGIVGMGLLAIPVLAGSSAYAISESLGKRQGLNSKLKQGYAFYGVIIISMMVGLGINFLGINPIKALIYSAVANGIVAPIILVQIMLLARDRKVMGEWKNGKLSAMLGWVLVCLMVFSGLAAIYSIV